MPQMNCRASDRPPHLNGSTFALDEVGKAGEHGFAPDHSYNRDVQAPPGAARAREATRGRAPRPGIWCAVLVCLASPCCDWTGVSHDLKTPITQLRLRAISSEDQELRRTTQPSSDAGCQRLAMLCYVEEIYHARGFPSVAPSPALRSRMRSASLAYSGHNLDPEYLGAGARRKRTGRRDVAHSVSVVSAMIAKGRMRECSNDWRRLPLRRRPP